MTEKDLGMPIDLLSADAIKSSDVLVDLTRKSDWEGSVCLTSDVVEAIKKLERYAVLSSHRIGEFRVG